MKHPEHAGCLATFVTRDKGVVNEDGEPFVSFGISTVNGLGITLKTMHQQTAIDLEVVGVRVYDTYKDAVAAYERHQEFVVGRSDTGYSAKLTEDVHAYIRENFDDANTLLQDRSPQLYMETTLWTAVDLLPPKERELFLKTERFYIGCDMEDIRQGHAETQVA